MTTSMLVNVLAVLKFAAVLVFAFLSKRRTEARMENPDAPKSSLAKDG